MKSPFHICNGLRLLGVGALIVGVLTAALLYYSFGTFPMEKAVYVFVGVLFASAGGLFLPAAVSLWNVGKPAQAAGVFLFWLAGILPLGLSGHAGFFSVAQSELAAQSIGAQAERARLDRVEAGLSSAVQYAGADVGALEGAVSNAQSGLDAARAKRVACPANYFKNCINPAQAEVQAAEEKLQVAQEQLRAAQGYKGLLVERENALSGLAAASAGVTGAGVHPLFDTLARITGADPARVQAIFLGWSAVALELIAAFSFIIAGTLSGRRDNDGDGQRNDYPASEGWRVPPQAATIPPAQTVPALDAGGRVVGEGLAHLHAGETVLNSAAAAALDKLYPGLADMLNRLGRGEEREAVERQTVKRENVEREAVGGTVRQCAHCGGDFTVTRKDRRYCGDECRAAAWEVRTGAKLRKGRQAKA